MAGFKDARTKEELTHTGGNVGHIDSVPLDEVARKKREEKRNLEIQMKMEKLKKLKEMVYRENKLLINPEKLEG